MTDVKAVISQSGKLSLLVELLRNLKNEVITLSSNIFNAIQGHRVLIFSMSVKMLDIIQAVLNAEKYRFTRMDGTITKLEERQDIIDSFTNDPSYFCFLLTTQVGGLGLNLISADRVIICMHARCSISNSRS